MLRHNEVCDFTASLLGKVCRDVKLEPHLQPLSGEIMPHCTAISGNEARADYRACGFWAPGMRKCSWMSGSSILMLTPTETYLLTPVSNGMNKPNATNMRSESGRLNIHLSLL